MSLNISKKALDDMDIDKVKSNFINNSGTITTDKLISDLVDVKNLQLKHSINNGDGYIDFGTFKLVFQKENIKSDMVYSWNFPFKHELYTILASPYTGVSNILWELKWSNCNTTHFQIRHDKQDDTPQFNIWAIGY